MGNFRGGVNDTGTLGCSLRLSTVRAAAHFELPTPGISEIYCDPRKLLLGGRELPAAGNLFPRSGQMLVDRLVDAAAAILLRSGFSRGRELSPSCCRRRQDDDLLHAAGIFAGSRKLSPTGESFPELGTATHGVTDRDLPRCWRRRSGRRSGAASARTFYRPSP